MEIKNQLTSLPLSFSALACCSSGRVWLGLKAVFSTAAAALSEPDLLYSFGSIFIESLSWVSLRASLEGADEKGLVAGTTGTRARMARAERRRNMVVVVVVKLGSCGLVRVNVNAGVR